MQILTYKQAYDKIIEAYFKNGIEPYDMQFCFCGTLGVKIKGLDIDWDEKLYSHLDYKRMERALLTEIRNLTVGETACDLYGCSGPPNYTGEMRHNIQNHLNYEEAIFQGMCAALEVLKEIHRSRGENVDEEVVPFTKRNLKPATV